VQTYLLLQAKIERAVAILPLAIGQGVTALKMQIFVWEYDLLQHEAKSVMAAFNRRYRML